MARIAQAQRTDDDERPRTLLWDGSSNRARELTEWARDSAHNTRFMWNPTLHAPGEARTLVEHPDVLNTAGAIVERGTSAEWILTPVGSVVERLGRDVDAPLRVRPPETDPVAILEAA